MSGIRLTCRRHTSSWTLPLEMTRQQPKFHIIQSVQMGAEYMMLLHTLASTGRGVGVF